MNARTGDVSSEGDTQDSSTVDVTLCERCGEPALCGGLGVLGHDVPYDHPDFGKLFRCPNMPPSSDGERQARLRRLSNLEAFADKRFNNFMVPRRGIGHPENVSLQRALSNARDFASNPEGWLVLSGRIGSGKTHLAAAVGNDRLARGDVVLFITAPDLLDHLRSTYGPSSETGYDEQFERIRNAQLLILDDLGAENPSRWAGEKLYQLLNHRHSKLLPTVITTNVDLDSLEGRIRSRMLDEAIIRHVEISAPDYRTPTARKDLELSWPSAMRLENFDTATGTNVEEGRNLSEALQIARDFAEKPKKWLVFAGDFGCGKTHLAAAIAYHQYERGSKVAFSTVPDLMDWFRVSFENSSSTSFQQRFQFVRNCPLLILDSLTASQGSPWVREKLFQLIDWRYNNELPTVFTTANEIEELDERIATRLIDRRRCQIFTIKASAYAERLGQPGKPR
ncbi:MAG: ATP-binding protein [Anaerolineaceae bacterium]|nr:ATP-binding protein [Anaerolineaceae bacterium]